MEVKIVWNKLMFLTKCDILNRTSVTFFQGFIEAFLQNKYYVLWTSLIAQFYTKKTWSTQQLFHLNQLGSKWHISLINSLHTVYLLWHEKLYLFIKKLYLIIHLLSPFGASLQFQAFCQFWKYRLISITLHDYLNFIHYIWTSCYGCVVILLILLYYCNTIY